MKPASNPGAVNAVTRNVPKEITPGAADVCMTVPMYAQVGTVKFPSNALAVQTKPEPIRSLKPIPLMTAGESDPPSHRNSGLIERS
jgi:hypothetical protein